MKAVPNLCQRDDSYDEVADRQDILASTRKEYEAIVAIFHELQKKRKIASNVDLMVEISGRFAGKGKSKNRRA